MINLVAVNADNIDLIILQLTQQMRRHQLRSRARNTRLANKIMLSEEEHSIIAFLLPRGYSLIRKSDLQDHLKREQVRKESRSKEKGEPQTFSAANLPIEQRRKEQTPSHANLDAQRASASTTLFNETYAEEQNLPRNDAPAQYSQKPKPNSKPKSALDKASSTLVNKAINEMINHESFTPIYSSRLKAPEILEQINKIKRKVKKSYMLDTFREDVIQLLQLYFRHHGRNQQAETFERLVQTKIVECNQQLSSLIQEANAREKLQQQRKPKDQQTEERRTRRRKPEKKVEQIEEPSINEDEESREEPKKTKKKKEEKSNKHQETDDSVSQSESLMISLPKRKGRQKFQEIPPRSKCSKILNSQIASLGYNFAKMKSEELFDIVTCLSGDKNQNMQQISSEITVDLEQLTTLQFVQLQAHVKNLLKMRNVEYEMLVDSDEDFVIEDDE